MYTLLNFCLHTIILKRKCPKCSIQSSHFSCWTAISTQLPCCFFTHLPTDANLGCFEALKFRSLIPTSKISRQSRTFWVLNHTSEQLHTWPEWQAQNTALKGFERCPRNKCYVGKSGFLSRKMSHEQVNYHIYQTYIKYHIISKLSPIKSKLPNHFRS